MDFSRKRGIPASISSSTPGSVAEVAARGFLLGPFPPQPLWRPLQLSQLALVDWPLLLTQTGKLVTILMVSSIALLLNASALELATRRDIDINRELFAAGIGNILAGLGGSPVGYQTISSTTLVHQMGAGSRITSLIVALMSGAALFFGASLLSFFPKAVIGALLTVFIVYALARSGAKYSRSADASALVFPVSAA